MRKILSITLAITLLIIPFTSALAADAKANLSIMYKAISNNKIQMDVMVDHFSNAYGAQIYINHNAELLTATEIAGGNVLPEDDPNVKLVYKKMDNQKGKTVYVITRVGSSSSGIEKGRLFRVIYNVKGSGDYKFSVGSESLLSDYSGTKVEWTFGGATEERVAPPVTPVTLPSAPIVDDVTSESNLITGRAQPYDYITITDKKHLTLSARADNTGSFSITLSSKLAPGTILFATTSNSAGYSEETVITVKDKTPARAPIVNAVTDLDTAVTGTTEAESIVTVKAGLEVLGTATANKNGAFSVSITPQKAASVLSITAVNIAGNVSTAVTVTVLDKTAPLAPSVSEITDITTNLIGKAEADSNLTIKAGSVILATGLADSNGNFSIPIPVQKAGTILSITATDKSGNVSTAVMITVNDKMAPLAPSVAEVTDSTTKLIGKAEADSDITVKVGAATLATGKADSNGDFSIIIPLQKASTILSVTTTDKSGNVSTAVMVTVLDKTAPPAPSVTELNDLSTNVIGKAEADANITIKVGSVTLATGSADANGNFSIAIPVQKASTILSATATDKSGNVSSAVMVTVKDKTAPEMPAVNEVEDNDTRVVGTAEGNSKISIYVGSKLLATGITSKNGDFSIPIPMQKADTILTLTSTDLAGNSSPETSVTVEDKTQPEAPTVIEVKDNDTKVTGKAEKNTKIIIKVGKTTIGSGTATVAGYFSIAIKQQKADTVLSITAIDKAGNTSSAVKVTVQDKTAPSVPVINEVNENDQKLTGKAEINSTIIIKAGKVIIGKGVTDRKGNLSVAIKPQKANTLLTVTASDEEGNTSPSAKIMVKDKTAPKIIKINKVTASSVAITGKAEPGVTVYAKAGSKTIGYATVNKTGDFSIKISKQKAGTVLTFVAQDLANNVGKAINITVVK